MKMLSVFLIERVNGGKDIGIRYIAVCEQLKDLPKEAASDNKVSSRS